MVKTDLQLTKNFKLSEFVNKSGLRLDQVTTQQIANLTRLARRLQELRDRLGKPIRINSALRSVAKNRAVGGARGSYHLTGLAADVQISAADQRALGLEKNWIGGYGRAGNWCHLDVRGKRARWKYAI